jgi:tetratricopeptide (TPR) repeat protein
MILKKRITINITAAMLLGTASLIIFFGCSRDNSIAIRYQAEKLLHKAEKLYSTAGIKPDLSSTLWGDVKRGFFEVTEYCWKHLDSIPADKHPKERQELEIIAFMATNRLSAMFYTDRKYDSSVFVLNQLLTLTNLSGKPLLVSRLNLARSMQARGSWSEAMQIYQAAIDTFYPPVDENNQIVPLVLNLPLEIVRINQMLGDSSVYYAESRAAENYYRRLITEWPNSALSTSARGNLARLFADQGRWDEAIENLRMLKDSTGQTDFEAELLIANITGAGKKLYPDAIRLYDNLIAKTSDTSIKPIIYAQKGIALFNNKNYAECRAIMGRIKRDYNAYFRTNSLPQNYIARSFEAENMWPMAENEFRWLIENFSTTEDAFNAYLTIADHYARTNESQMAETWYGRAEEFYNKMASQYSGTYVEASAISYKAEIARRNKKWEEAAQNLEELFRKFPQTEIGQKALLNAASAYREKLNNPARADSLINLLKKELMPLEESKNISSLSDDNK